MKSILKTGILVLALMGLTPFKVAAETGGAIASGWATNHIVPLRLSLQQSLCGFWNPDPERLWPFKVYTDGEFYYLGSSQHYQYRYGGGHLRAFSLGGYLRFSHDPTFLNRYVWPYIDVGLGAAWLSHKKISGRRLGMNFQVLTKLGAGIRFGALQQYDIGYRYTNFSNGFLAHPNDTINLHMIVLAYWFP
jgi:Lipid A 3-O-deacylase (PagL)